MHPSLSATPQRVAIIGASRLGTYLGAFLPQTPGFSCAGYFDDTFPPGTPNLLGTLADIPARFAEGKFDSLMVGIGYGNMEFRKQIYERLAPTIPFATCIHPTAWVDESARIGPGCYVAPLCMVDQDAVLEANVMLNLGVMVAHNARVGTHSFLAGFTLLAGYVEIGELCYMGIRTTAIDKITLGARVRSGASATFIKSAPDPGLYVGTPARWVKE